MSEELKNRTKRFALETVGLCAGLPQVLENRHAIGQVIPSRLGKGKSWRGAVKVIDPRGNEGLRVLKVRD